MGAASLGLGLGASNLNKEWGFFSKESKITSESNSSEDDFLYRALTKQDLDNYLKGKNIQAKAPDGKWSASDHVSNFSADYGGTAQTNSSWISTTKNKSVANGYDSGHGVAEINPSKIENKAVEVWRTAPRKNGIEGLPYHRSIWAEEVTVHKEIPHSSINNVKRTKK